MLSNSLIFIDVDGVLNPDSQRDGFTEYNILDFTVYLNPVHGEWLLNLAKETNSELVWGTMWEDLANVHIASKIGLPQLPVMKIQQNRWGESTGASKAYSAKLYAKDRTFVFFDDEVDLGNYLGDVPSGEHIRVKPYLGLLENHIFKARDFLIL